MNNPAELADQVRRFIAQQHALYGEHAFWLGIQAPRASEPVSATPVVEMPKREAAPLRRDLSAQERLAALRTTYQACTRCELAKSRKQVVIGSGSPFAKVMFIGEAPGRDEDLKGLPFVGPAGEVLERMLKRMGFTRREVYITNIVKCRPPQNRDPLEDEIKACATILSEQVQIIKPVFIFCLGRVAANTLLQKNESLANLRGKTYRCFGARLFVTYHPAAILRDKQLSWEVYEDMKRFRRAYDEVIGDKPPMVEVQRKQ